MTVNTLAREGIQTPARTTTASPLTYARIAGVLYLVITIAAIIAHFYVPSELIVADDAAATAANIRESEALFRFGGVGAEMVVLLSEIAVDVNIQDGQ